MGPIDKMQARKELGLAEDENIILQLGRIVPRKGVETVIRGLARLVYDQGIEARLLVVGGNSEDPDPKKTPEIGRLQAIAAKEKVSDRVTFVGRRGREVLKHFYSAADVFVSTPWYEPFGITPVEAMACGTPVIGSRVGGIQYTVADGETGFLISPRDDVALGDHLARIFQDDELLGQLSRNAIERVNRLFTWKQVGDSIAKLYDQAIKEAKQVTIMEAKENKNTSSTELAVDPVRSQQVDIIERNFKTAVKVMQLSRDGLREPVLETARSMINTLVRGGKVMVAGNGGSAADAQHFAAEFVGRFMYPDRQGLPVMALTADTAFLTAWSNDVSYDKVFSRQVETFGQPGDMLIGISTSGRSCNLIEAFEVASSKGITCVGLLGGDGGELLQLADIAIVVPSANAQRIQEVQIVVLHTLSELVEAHFVSTPSLLARLGASSRSSWDMQPGIPVELPGRK
jgi:phosphoheptose isomerase